MNKIIDRPIFAVIFFTIIILLGIFSFMRNPPIELVPEADLPSLNVRYYWYGASPDLILRKVLMPAEEEIMQIKGVSKINSYADLGWGEIKVEFSRNSRMNFSHMSLSERLNKLQKSLPLQVRKPDIQQYVPDDFEKKPLLTVGLIAKNRTIFSLKKIAEKDVLPHLKSISGVEKVDILGGVEPEIKIQTNMNILNKLNLSIYHIRQKIQENFYTIQSIALKKDSQEITLSLTRNPDSIKEIQEILLAKQGEKKILLKDVANVYFGYQELTSDMRFQGHSTIGFQIYKERNQNSFVMSKRVKSKLQNLANRLKKDQVEFIIRADESKELKDNLLKLVQIAFLILIIIFLILITIFKDFKVSLLIFSSVFFSVFTTFTVIYLLKIPMNLLTLSGLALGVGLFVDNAVVVFDSIARFKEKGHNMRYAAVEGSKTVFLPVVSSTMTTIIVFFSFALFEGRLRVYYLPLAYVIAISLVSSIVVSFILIPSLSARMNIKTKKIRSLKKIVKYSLLIGLPFIIVLLTIFLGGKLFTSIPGIFTLVFDFLVKHPLVIVLLIILGLIPILIRGKLFAFFLKYPVIVILPIIFLFFTSLSTFKKEVSFGQFFSWYSKEELRVALWFTSSVDFKDIKDQIVKFEKIALAKPYDKEITTRILANWRYAEMRITFPKEIEFSAYPLQLKQELTGLATNLAGIGVYIAGFDQEPYWYNPDTGSFLAYSIQIKGYNYERLLVVANELKKSLLNHRRIKEVEIDTSNRYRGGKEKYFAFRLDRSKIKKYKIKYPLYEVLYQVASYIQEKTSTQKLKLDDKELTVEIKVHDVKDIELDDILNKEFVTFDGIPFRIEDVVNIELTTQKGGISRENQEYIAFVKWDYLGSNKAADRFHKTVYKNLQVPAGFKKSLEEKKFRMTEEEEKQLWSAIIHSAILIFLILGMLYNNFFQPLLIMISIPLALIGVWNAFVIMDYNFDSKAYVGVILLCGIVVNNAILLIDNINRHLKKSRDIIKAITAGARERIRPILITSSTTVLGMIPLIAMTKAGQSSSDIWSSLALCIVGGLTTSALLVILVLPIFYLLLYKLQKFLFSKKEIQVKQSIPSPTQ